MKRIISITSGVLFLVLFACQTGEKTADSGVKHFRHLKFNESPWDKFEGMHSITAEEADSVNNYKFSYDQEGRLVSVEFCRGDELLGGSRTGSPRILISYEENKETHHYFDQKGEAREHRGYFAAEYELDENGVRTGLRFLDKEGNNVEDRNEIAWYTWKILANDQLQENRYKLNGEETVMSANCPFYELRFTYDENGFVTDMANYQGDTAYNCTVENCGDIGVHNFSFEYNEAGDMTDFTVRSLSGQLSNLYAGWARFEQKYDENGNITERAMFDQDDEPLGGMTVPVRQMVYDEHGAVVELKHMDIDRNLINHPSSGIAVSKYGYDESGHPKDTLNYNAGMVAL
ncbi:hypothetical protein ACFLTU_05210 [Bacteroidota bacterium]